MCVGGGGVAVSWVYHPQVSSEPFNSLDFINKSSVDKKVIKVAHVELDITPLASPTRSLNSKDSISIFVFQIETRREEGALLFDPTHCRTGRRLDFHFLKTTEAYATFTTIRSYQSDHLEN